MNLNKKIQERKILDRFRQQYQEFPKGRIYHSESPDFILKTSPRYSIGIELTSLPSASNIMSNRANIHHILAHIHQSIVKKEEKIKLYQKTMANDYWLILHTGSIQKESFNFFNYIEKMESGNTFGKIFLFDLQESIIYSIK